jgi:hypothetical protein
MQRQIAAINTANATPKIEAKKVDIKALEQNLLAFTDSDKWLQYLNLRKHFRRYSMNNVLLIQSQYPTATMVLGFQAWKKLGRHVKGGERAIMILAPMVKKDVDTDTKVCYGFRTVSVFDVSQTSGESLPLIEDKISGEITDHLMSKLLSYCLKQNIPVGYKPLTDCYGYCDFKATGAVITLNSSLPSLHQFKTLVHELAHASLHQASEYKTHNQKSICEFEAESVSYLVCNTLGLDTTEYSLGCIATWLNGDKEKMVTLIRDIETKIVKVANEILDYIESD